MLDAAVVGKVFWTGALRPRRARSQHVPLTRAEGIRSSPEAIVGRRRERARVRSRARARRRVRTDPTCRARREASQRRRMDRVARTAGGPRRDARIPLALCTRPREREWDRGLGPRRPRALRTARCRRPCVRARQPRGGCVALRRRARAVAGGRRRAARAPVSARRRAASGIRRDAPAARAGRSPGSTPGGGRHRTRERSGGVPGACLLGSRSARSRPRAPGTRGSSRGRLDLHRGCTGARLLGSHPKHRGRDTRKHSLWPRRPFPWRPSSGSTSSVLTR